MTENQVYYNVAQHVLNRMIEYSNSSIKIDSEYRNRFSNMFTHFMRPVTSMIATLEKNRQEDHSQDIQWKLNYLPDKGFVPGYYKGTYKYFASGTTYNIAASKILSVSDMKVGDNALIYYNDGTRQDSDLGYYYGNYDGDNWNWLPVIPFVNDLDFWYIIRNLDYDMINDYPSFVVNHSSEFVEISGNAVVKNNAKISDVAKIYDNAVIQDNAIVHKYGKVFENAIIKDNAEVTDYGQVYGDAIVGGTTIVNDYDIINI